MQAYCFLRNVVDLVSPALEEEAEQQPAASPYKLRFGEDFRGPLIPFWSRNNYKPSSQQDKDRLHAFGAVLLSGIFVGYQQHAGGGWTGYLLITDSTEIEKASSPSAVHVKRFKAAEVFPVKVGEHFRFPLRCGDIKQSGNLPRALSRRARPSERPTKRDEEDESEESAVKFRYPG